MNKCAIILAMCSAFVLLSVDGAPQNINTENAQRYSSYSYEYRVEDAEQKLFHDKSESSDDNGKVLKV